MMQLEETKQLCTGEADAACMAEIGGALGVDFLVYGEVAKIADTYSLSLVLLDIRKAEAANRVNKKITDPRQLLDETDSAAKLLVQPLLEGKKGFLVLEIREGGAKVSVDGRTVGVTPLAGRLELAMGAHEVAVEKEGFLTWARTIDIPPGQATVESVALVPSQEFIEAYSASASRTRTIAWITGGAAVALAGAAGVLRLSNDGRFDDLVAKGYIDQRDACAEVAPDYDGASYCPTALGYENGVVGTIDSIETMDTIALGAVLAGVATGAVSLYLWLSGDDPARYDAFGASVGPGAASLSIDF
ncbi:PEGA domain-containing protein [Myxococcota bacterium]|nr:PEGA domain-containing protein [Myxococcota bacterium]